MLSVLESYTSLPNLHPAVLHFPIVLLPLGVVFDFAQLFVRKSRVANHTAEIFYALSLVALGITYRTGRSAAEAVGLVSPDVEAALARHSDWALYSLWVLGILVAIRFLMVWIARSSSFRAFRVATIVMMMLALGFLFRTADLGGALVYQHGVAVSAVGTAFKPIESPNERLELIPTNLLKESYPSDRLRRTSDGQVVWAPIERDSKGFSELFEIISPTPIVPIGDPERDPLSEGVRLRVSKETTLLFTEVFEDVQVTLTFEPIGFEGNFVVLHHVQADGFGGSISLSAEGVAVLSDQSSRAVRLLDQKRGIEIPKGVLSLSVSTSGRHIKSFLNKKMIAHGHQSISTSGRCGFSFQGSGDIRIISLQITPLHGGA